MKRAGYDAIAGALLLLAPTPPSAGQPFPLPGAKSARYVDFSVDDFRAQRIARKSLAKEIAEEGGKPSDFQSFRTAWARVSDGASPYLFVRYGCSASGNCGLYGFERTGKGWRRVLNGSAQMCWILSSSHGGRRDISVSLHGSATESTIETYWWRMNRYVRVSERKVIYK